jgi:hypothetical protein
MLVCVPLDLFTELFGSGRGSSREDALLLSPPNPPNPWLPSADGLVTEDRLYEAIMFEVMRLPAAARMQYPFQHPQYEAAWKALEPVFSGHAPSYTFPSGRTLTPLTP